MSLSFHHLFMNFFLLAFLNLVLIFESSELKNDFHEKEICIWLKIRNGISMTVTKEERQFGVATSFSMKFLKKCKIYLIF